MFWNYRIVNLRSENCGEDWYCVREVFYDENGKLEGHSDVSVGSESLEDVLNVLDMMRKATELPALQESDFHDETRKNKFSDFSEFMEYCINNDVRGL